MEYVIFLKLAECEHTVSPIYGCFEYAMHLEEIRVRGLAVDLSCGGITPDWWLFLPGGGFEHASRLLTAMDLNGSAPWKRPGAPDAPIDAALLQCWRRLRRPTVDGLLDEARQQLRQRYGLSEI